MRRRCVKFGFIVLTLSDIGQWKFNMAPHGKELSEDLKRIITTLHKDGLCYKKIANSLKLSCSTVAMSMQWFNRTGSTQNRPHLGRPKTRSAHAQCHIHRFSLENRRMGAASIAAEVEGVGGQPVSAQTIRHTLIQIGLHGCHHRKKMPLLKMMPCASSLEEALFCFFTASSLLKTSRLRTWIIGTMSFGLMRPR